MSTTIARADQDHASDTGDESSAAAQEAAGTSADAAGEVSVDGSARVSGEADTAGARSASPDGAGSATSAAHTAGSGARSGDSAGAAAADAGAGALGELVPVPGAEFAEIPLKEIRANTRNPRTAFDDDELDELAASLREVGVLQPIVVRPVVSDEHGTSFELVMGERRWRAARRAKLLTIPAIIRDTSDDDMLRDALLENLHRTQLNPLEEAAAYSQLLEDFSCTQDELSEKLGRSRPQISNTLRLLRLPPLVQRRVISGALSAGHARALLGAEDPQLMEELAQRIVAEGLSVRQTERLVQRGGALENSGSRSTPRSTYNPAVVEYTSRLSNRLRAPVRIDVGKRKGKVTLEFTSMEDLERILDELGVDPS